MSGGIEGVTSADYVERADYRWMRPTSDRRCPTVVLLHGLGGRAQQPLAYVPDELELPVLAPDLRGHGRTRYIGPPDGFTFTTMADDVAALLDRLDIGGPLLLIGVSMGAGIAIRIAHDAPDRVLGILAIRPAWCHEASPPNLSAYPLIAALLRRDGPAMGLSAFAETSTYREILDSSPAAARSARDQFTSPYAVERAARLERMPRSVPYDHPSDLAVVTAATVVLGAAGDPVHPLAMAQEWAANLPAAEYGELVARDVDAIGQARQIRSATADFLRPHRQGRTI
jgi:pimeloyl-ACP methyl ester carboxylesterase